MPRKTKGNPEVLWRGGVLANPVHENIARDVANGMSQGEALKNNGLTVKRHSQWFYYNAHVRERVDQIQTAKAERSIEKAVLSLEEAHTRLKVEIDRSAAKDNQNAVMKGLEMWIRCCGGFNDKVQIDDLTRNMRALPDPQILDHIVAQVESNPLLKRALIERLRSPEPESNTTH